MSKFAERLKLERINSHISRQNLADNLNISVRTISYWESGQRECDFDTLIKLSNILGTSIDYLLGKEN